MVVKGIFKIQVKKITKRFELKHAWWVIFSFRCIINSNKIFTPLYPFVMVKATKCKIATINGWRPLFFLI